MIPLKDINRSKSAPVITIGLIVLNALFFFYELSLDQQSLAGCFYIFGVTPSFYFNPSYWQSMGVLGGILPLLTSMFLHGGWLHFGGNMLYLWVFGDNVEDRVGHARFLVFYLACGLAAALLHIFTNPNSTFPTVGASGAIAGVLGAYLLMFPRARVLTLIPIFFFFQLVELPALIFLGFWFVMQFFSGAISLTTMDQQTGGTAWWAHVGGFITGIAFTWSQRGMRKRRVFYC